MDGSGRNVSIRTCPLLSWLILSCLFFAFVQHNQAPFSLFLDPDGNGCAVSDSHIYRIALRRSLCYESGWSLVTAAAIPHGDYLNRMAHTHVCCVHIYTCIHIHIYIHMWTATLCAL